MLQTAKAGKLRSGDAFTHRFLASNFLHRGGMGRNTECLAAVSYLLKKNKHACIHMTVSLINSPTIHQLHLLLLTLFP